MALGLRSGLDREPRPAGDKKALTGQPGTSAGQKGPFPPGAPHPPRRGARGATRAAREAGQPLTSRPHTSGCRLPRPPRSTRLGLSGDASGRKGRDSGGHVEAYGALDAQRLQTIGA